MNAASSIAYELARRDLIQFSLLTMKNYSPSWHHRLLARKLEAVERGEIDRLMVFMPPRHGKSELVSVRFPAWCLGRNPDKRLICSSYSFPLARRFSRQVRENILSDRFGQVFPQCTLKSDVRAVDAWETTMGGGLISVGVGGSITGMGGDLIDIDDPIKNQEQAESAVYREKVKDWYRSTLYTRLEKGGRVIITLTRWHEDDLAGWLLEEMSQGGDQWDILSLPAVAEENEEYRQEGQALWPEKYNQESLCKMEKAVGSRVWNALYQQRPAPDSGDIFKREWWQFYDTAPVCDNYFQSWDMTFKDTDGSDFVVGQVWGVKGANRYLIDQIRGRMDFVSTVRAVEGLSAQYPQATAKYVEDKANGTAVISMLKSKIVGLIPVEPRGSKISRAYAVSPLIEAGNVWLKRGASYTGELIEECTSFPNGAHDDQVDAMTQALGVSGKKVEPAFAATGARTANNFNSFINKSALRGY